MHALPLLEVIVPCDNIPNVKERPNLAFNVGFAIERGCDDCIRVVAAIGMGLLVRLCNTSLAIELPAGCRSVS